MLEAVVWEHANNVRQDRGWDEVAAEMVLDLESSWPASLCSVEQSASAAVKLGARALTERFKRLCKDRVTVSLARQRAVKLIELTQLYSPPPSTRD